MRNKSGLGSGVVRVSWLSGLMMAAALTLSVGSARAEGSDDVVFLKKGGRVRGTVMVEDKANGVSVKLADGTTRNVPAAEVERVEYGGSQAAAPSTYPEPSEGSSPAPAAAVPPPAEPEEKGPLVTIESEIPTAALNVVIAEGAGSAGGYVIFTQQWQTVCSAPCNKRLDPSPKYRFSGDEVSTGTFRLPADSDKVTLRLDSGSGGLRAGGVTMITFGVIGISLGVSFTVLALLSPDTFDDYLVPGLISLGGGTALTVGGFVMAKAGMPSVTTDRGVELADRARIPVGASLRGQF